MRIALIALSLVMALPCLRAANTLDVYFVDVEGGQATLIVSPSGESMLVDTGWPGFNNRDADRIAAAAKEAGVKQIDYLVITHYHTDHVGGVPQLSTRLPIRHFVDHGANTETGQEAEELFAAYTKVRDAGKHLLVKPGDKVPIKGLEVQVLTAGGDKISRPLKGAGAGNPLCSSTKLLEQDPSENARSVGTLITYGKFRLIDLGDLTWNKEYELVCPKNLVGTVDVYLTTHHGMDISGPPAIVHALRPRVAVMNNGARKGGSPGAWQVLHGSPGIAEIWQVHRAIEGGSENNAPEEFVANMDEEKDQAFLIKLSAKADGSFTVTNTRNGNTKSYPAR